ncbi:MAG: GNAT family N-acetyltransferase [Clostridiales bacterium]|nr:GNAT family N-acetyltransferase [Clostridiales bacterium]
MKEQIARIKKYEELMREAEACLKLGWNSERFRKVVSELEEYYASDGWKEDFAADERGELPKTLKRGVLSEDGLYNLLGLCRELIAEKDPSLETKRLVLRPWKEADAEECFEYAKDPRVGPPAGWPPHKNVEETREIISSILSAPETYAIVLKETGSVIGSIALMFSTDHLKRGDEAELGYWIGVPYWGRGLVPEASRELLRHGFEDLNLERIWCAYYEGNEKSKRVQEKLGFKHFATKENVPVTQLNEARTDHINLLTKEEWIGKCSYE